MIFPRIVKKIRTLTRDTQSRNVIVDRGIYIPTETLVRPGVALISFAKIVYLAVSMNAAVATTGPIAVKGIRIDGLTRTDSEVVTRELEINPGDQVSEDDIANAVQRIRNLGIFSDVNGKVDTDGTLVVSLSERWTLIPIAKFASGGGVNQLIFGLFNSNLFGQYKETGAQFERLGNTNSGVVWYRDPWFVGNRIGIDFQVWNSNRIRTKYEPGEIDPVVKTGFLHSRKKAFLGISNQLFANLEVKPYVEYHQDAFADKYLEPEVSEKVKVKGLPPDTQVAFYGLVTKYGTINYTNWLQDGMQIELNTRYADMKSLGYDDFYVADMSLRYYRTFFSDQSFAFRASTGSTDTEVLQYWNYFGGLADVRGFSDNRFAGRAYWLANSEWRLPVFKRDWMVIQQVTFFDTVATGEYYSRLQRATGSSVGLGLRIIAPKIYRLVARIDVAKPLVRRDEMPVSFGVQQFF